jgi:Fe-S oxidoreductase/nitrate reductase gamma subunit
MQIERIHFWGIDAVALFYVLAAISVAVFAAGLYIRLSVWLAARDRQKLGLSVKGIGNLCKDGLLGRKIFKGNIPAGLMHFLIMWGFVGLFIGTVLSTAHHYLIRFLTGDTYLIFSFCLEVFGFMLIAGLLLAFIRRYIARVARLDNKAQDLWMLVLIAACALTGFLVEGTRLAVRMPGWESFSFGGVLFSALLSSEGQAEEFYPYMWWLHALLSLGLVAYFPFSKLFHSMAAPVNIYIGPQTMHASSSDDVSEDKESEGLKFTFTDMIDFSACTRCGRCNEVCPSTSAKEPFSPREFIAQANEYTRFTYNPLSKVKWLRERLFRQVSPAPRISPEQIWFCTTCRACLEVCPVYIGAFDPIRRVRNVEIENGDGVSLLLTKSLETLYKFDNPWEPSKKKRAEWSKGLTVPDLTAGAKADLCYFVDCTTSIDTRTQNLARAFVKIMTQAGISFGTLGQKETCCGDIARRVGEEGLFEEQAEKTTTLFEKYGITDVVTSSPHCFNVIKNEYPPGEALKTGEEKAAFRIRHYTQLLEELLDKGAVKPVNPVNIKVTFHDPCYLGRYNEIYEAPRKVIRCIPGVSLVEMAHWGPDSLCCGGGGGRMWQELEGEQKLAEVRIREAEDTGADAVVTSCPYCLIMLEDAVKTAELKRSLKVMDLNELVAKSLGLSDEEET